MSANTDFWKPARKFPLTYPGLCPDDSFLLLDNNILPLTAEDSGAFFAHAGTNEPVAVDRILEDLNLPPVDERIAVLAYGANRNPATLKIKFENYRYKSPGHAIAVPMLKAYIKNADVVASGFHGQGYFFGDLLLDTKYTNLTETEVWVMLLDGDQLRVMNDSEHIKTGMYTLCDINQVMLCKPDVAVTPLCYIGTDPLFVSKHHQTPIAFSTVSASNRNIPAKTTAELIDHFIQVYDLDEKIAALINNHGEDVPLHKRLSGYMNDNWWKEFNKQHTAHKGYKKILKLFNGIVKASNHAYSLQEKIKDRCRMIDTRDPHYYRPFEYKNLIN